jgi:hypothetical protein
MRRAVGPIHSRRMQSKAATVEEYLASLPPDRREALSAIRKVILANLGEGYEEGMGYGMMGYYVPHSVYPPGYHCDPSKPLPFAGMASQKQYISVYLMSVYGDGTPEEKWFRQAWAKTGKKLNMGKCCVRFKRLEDAALEVIGEAIRRVPVKDFIKHYETTLRSIHTSSAKGGSRGGSKSGRADGAKARKKAATGAGKKTTRKVGKKAAKKTGKRSR